MKAPTTYPEPSGWDYTVFHDAQYVIQRVYSNVTGPDGDEHRWWTRRYYLNSDRPLHPVVDSFIKQWRPLDWQQLLLEWPHVSTMDPTKIAYTPNQRYGVDDRQLVTSIGKYLNKHWPHVPDHLRRDAVAAYSFDEMHFVHTTPEIIQGIEMGPRSCMQSGYGSIPFNGYDYDRMVEWFKDKANVEPDWQRHPYCVYAPELGWHMAVRVKDGEFLGRALCLKHNDTNVFVRTYSRRSGEDSNSSSDHMLEQWLQAQGYEHQSEWPNGAKLLRVDHPTKDGLMAPYIDGPGTDARKVDDDGEYLVINYGNGRLTCDNTDGTVDGSQEEEYDYHCEDCGAGINCEDDGYANTGRHEDRIVCDSCLDNYTLVRASSRWDAYREYYIHDNDAVELQCGSYSIDEDNPPSNVRQLENGDWAEEDDVVMIDGEYYLSEDEDVVELANEWDDNMYALKASCWQCEGSGNWYHDDDTDDQVELDDGLYHRDHLSSLVNAKQVPLALEAIASARDSLPEPLVARVEAGPVPVTVTVTSYPDNEALLRAVQRHQTPVLMGSWVDECSTATAHNTVMGYRLLIEEENHRRSMASPLPF
jgi:hypothetical protein